MKKKSMNDFEIISPDGEDILLQSSVADQFQSLALKGGRSFQFDCSFGNMLFHHYKGDGFDLWKSNYLIDRPANVIGRANVPLLEFSVMYENSLAIDWKGIGQAVLPARRIELYHAPYMDNLTRFTPGKTITTVDFHFHRELLECYADEFPLLARFMEKVHKNEPAQLFDGTQFACLRIDAVIKEMLDYGFRDELAARYYDSYAHILLTILLERISGFNPSVKHFKPTDIEKAYRAKELLTTQIDKAYTIKELSKLLYTNPYKLKTCFKYLFGTSIGKYKKNIQMEQAKLLLRDGNYTTDDVAMLVGYSASQNFSNAFHHHFNITPSDWRKK